MPTENEADAYGFCFLNFVSYCVICNYEHIALQR